MEKKPYVVGITGGTCSGKSTLANRLEELLKPEYKVTVFHMDRYFKKPSPTTIAPITRVEYVEHNHPTSFDLDRLYADFQSAVDARTDEAPDIVIIEGLFILYLDTLRDQLDLKIFIDLKSDERIIRRIRQYMKRGITMEDTVSRYLDTVRFRHDELIEPMRWHADMIINGTLDTNKGSEILLTYLKAQLGRE